ncbi:hypothetical protein DV951_12280 [Staphylococcus pseudintermedius]|nr:hypothetical protein DV951_12280 [Staphylococcus pseudintermedius]
MRQLAEYFKGRAGIAGERQAVVQGDPEREDFPVEHRNVRTPEESGSVVRSGGGIWGILPKKR